MKNANAADVKALWAQLRRRKVVQWGIAYAAAAWGFLQGLEYAGEAFGWPAHLRQVAILAFLIGLPIVLTLAWYHGDRGEQRIGGVELTIVTLLLVLGGGVLWLYDRAGESPVSMGRTTAQTAASAAAHDPRPSIAVLPFENRSRLADDEFFVDGIHDDILTQLSKIAALKVISRTSVEQFRDSNLPAKSIAARLGVTKILEGGVQRAGERVRINVQLVDADSDAHLWAESYDRELTAANIFAIQSEVASAVSDALKATLTPSERRIVSTMPTQNLEAWEAYQLGRHRMARRTSEALTDAAGFFEKAIERDPSFALAQVGLADTLLLQAEYGGVTREAATARASLLVTRARALDGDLAEAAASSAMLAWTMGDYSKAEVEFQRAIRLNPNSAQTQHWYGGLLRELGRAGEARMYVQRAAQLDPLSAIVRANLSEVLADLGQFEGAMAALGRAVEIDPSQPAAYVQIGQLKAYAFGRIDEAVPWVMRSSDLDPGQATGPAWLSAMYFDLGDYAAAEHALAQASRLDTGQVPPKLMACIAALYRGQSDLAVKYGRDTLNLWPRAALMLAVLRDADLQTGDYSSARARYAQAYPELLGTSPRVDSGSYQAAIDLALVLRRSGDNAAGTKLLDFSEKVVRDGTRLGINGFGIADVQIRAVRGEKREALAALREAAQTGWRGPLRRYYLDHDPNLASIRNEPEFRVVLAEIERDMAAQRARLASRPKDAPLDMTEASR